MATFELKAPDGTVYEIEAPDMQTAARAFKKKEASSTGAGRSWSDVPGEALRNIPQSAANFGKAIVQPILHPIDTLTALKDIGVGLGSKALSAAGVPMDPEKQAEREAPADAVGKFFKDRYGSVEGIKNTLATDPVGAAADVATVLTGGGAAAARAPGIVGKAGQVIKSAGQMIDPLRAPGALMKGTGKIAAEALGVTTGAGSEPLTAAYQAGKAGNQTFVDHMRGQAPMSDVIDMAQGGVRQLRQNRSQAYNAGMASTRANTKLLDPIPIRQALNNAFGKTRFQTVVKDPDAANTVSEMLETVNRYTATPNQAWRTPEGLDALKQSIGEIRNRAQPGTLARMVADDVYQSIKAQIVKEVPEYAATMKGYEQASDQINDISRTFSLGEKAAPDTAMRKLQSVMRNNVNTNYGNRTRLMDELSQYQPELRPALAGQALNSMTPRGLSKMLAGGGGIYGAMAANPTALAMLPMTSPRLMGEAAYAMGQGAQKVSNAMGSTGMTPDALAEALMASYAANQVTSPALEAQGLRGGIGPRYENGTLRR